MNDIQIWNDFVLQQMAAESYLNGIDWSNPDLAEVRRRLALGNNNPDYLQFIDPNDPTTYGKTRMTEVQAQYFVEHWEIVDHHANDASGFSATLMRDKTTGEYTLVFRSTEYRQEDKGGDYGRDALGADMEISGYGFAFGQLLAMEDYYAKLKADGTLPAGAVLNVSGYSLGGHLATVFTELHTDEVNHTYIFNSPGRGLIPFGDVPGMSMKDKILELLAKFDASLHTLDPNWDAYAADGSNNLYNNANYQIVRDAILAEYQPTLSSGDTLGILDSKITALYGHATHNDAEQVANSGIHAPATPIFIEDQPLWEGLIGQVPIPGIGDLLGMLEGDFGNTHSITLLADSLAVMNLFASLDPTLTPEIIGILLGASSNEIAPPYAPQNVDDQTEAHSLENALDALRKLFLGDSITETEANSQAGGFGDINKREVFYNNLKALSDSTLFQQSVGMLRINVLTVQSRAQLVESAKSDIAYRYALVNLNPFAITGDAAIYEAHNANGELDLYDPATGEGTMTELYLADRAAMLAWMNQINTQDIQGQTEADGAQAFSLSTTTGTPYLFQDTGSNTRIHIGNNSTYDPVTQTATVTPSRRIYFGGDAADSLTGASSHDHLYGMGGDDTLTGGGGNDYMEGGQGDDTYVITPGDGYDTVLDTDGQGVIKFGTIQATGSTGLDPSKWIHAPGSNTWLDTQNHITYIQSVVDGHNQLLIKQGDASVLVKDWTDGELGIELDAGNDPTAPVTPLTLTGDRQPLDQDASQAGIQSGYDSLGNLIVGSTADPGRIDLIYDSVGNDRLQGLGGDDLLSGRRGGDDILEGGDGSDTLTDFGGGNDQLYAQSLAPLDTLLKNQNAAASGLRGDFLYAGTGDDLLAGDTGNDLLIGGAGDDLIVGGAGDDNIEGDMEIQGVSLAWSVTRTVNATAGGTSYETTYNNLNGVDWPTAGGDDAIYGGGGADWVRAGGGNDYVDGGEDDDVLFGEGDNDVLQGGAGNDIISGDNPAVAGLVEGDDFLDGGDGDDKLYGNGGADYLLGGTGNDLLIGDEADAPADQQGNDSLDGGAGNDRLYGRGGDDLLTGGDGDDTLSGEDGNDVLQGGAGLDQLFGGAGKDVLAGGTEVDYLVGNEGDDTLDGGDGDDQLFGEAGNDTLAGGLGDDRLQAGADDDSLDGGDGNDLLFGEDGSDTLTGGAGNDYLLGGLGNDTLDGGEGNDIYYYRLGEGNDRFTDSGGTDWLVLPDIYLSGVKLGLGSMLLTLPDGGEIHLEDFDPDNPYAAGGIEYFQFADGSVLTKKQLIDSLGFTPTGTPFDDDLSGTALADVITALDGDDVVNARAGNDTIYADGGADTVYAGEGNDVVHGGDGNDALFGEGGNDSLLGEVGNDFISGGVGADTLQGGEGDDTYLFNIGDGQDVVTDALGQNSIALGAGLTLDKIRLARQGDDLLVSINGTTDKLTVTGWFAAASAFAGLTLGDGTVLDHAGVEAALARNLAPVAVQDTAAVKEDSVLSVSGNALANDSDPEGRALRVTDAGTRTGSYGVLTLQANGAYVYTLSNAAGAVQALAAGQSLSESFAYSVSDDEPTGAATAQSTIVVTIQGTNDLPVLGADIASTFEDAAAALSGNVLSNDSDVDAGTSLFVANAGQRNGVYGTLSLGANGAYVYTLNNGSAAVQGLAAGQTVTENFAFLVGDGIASVAGNLAITITGRNDAPVLAAALQDQTTAPNTSWTWQVPAGSFTDADAGDALTYTATLADGSALPSWLQFDAATQTFSGRAPKSATGSLDIRVGVSDRLGENVSDVFTLGFSASSGGGGNGGGGGGSQGNEGVGNGVDGPPPGHDGNQNDGAGTSPGNPGSSGGNGNARLSALAVLSPDAGAVVSPMAFTQALAAFHLAGGDMDALGGGMSHWVDRFGMLGGAGLHSPAQSGVPAVMQIPGLLTPKIPGGLQAVVSL